MEGRYPGKLTQDEPGVWTLRMLDFDMQIYGHTAHYVRRHMASVLHDHLTELLRSGDVPKPSKPPVPHDPDIVWIPVRKEMRERLGV